MATRYRIHPHNPQLRQIESIVDQLHRGAVMLYPTDTVYAIGCDPLALTGPTGGDLNTGDPIDDLIADAMDETPAKTQPSEPQASVKPAPVDTPQETTASPIAEVPLTPPEEPKDQPPTPQPPQD